MPHSLKLAATEAKETFLGLVVLFKNLFKDMPSIPFVDVLKNIIASILSGIATPFIIVFCYLTSFAIAEPIEQPISIKVPNNENKERYKDTSWFKPQ